MIWRCPRQVFWQIVIHFPLRALRPYNGRGPLIRLFKNHIGRAGHSYRFDTSQDPIPSLCIPLVSAIPLNKGPSHSIFLTKRGGLNFGHLKLFLACLSDCSIILIIWLTDVCVVVTFTKVLWNVIWFSCWFWSRYALGYWNGNTVKIRDGRAAVSIVCYLRRLPLSKRDGKVSEG